MNREKRKDRDKFYFVIPAKVVDYSTLCSKRILFKENVLESSFLCFVHLNLFRA